MLAHNMLRNHDVDRFIFGIFSMIHSYVYTVGHNNVPDYI